MVTQWYACTGVEALEARCQGQAQEGSERCPVHQDSVQTAPQPDVVLVKFFTNANQSQRLEVAGIRRVAVDQEVQEEQHVAAAEAAGRNPYKYREIADAGVQIFGEKGLPGVQLSQMLDDLGNARYVVVDTHLVLKRGEKKDILAEVFVRRDLVQKRRPVPFPAQQQLSRFWESSWKFVHVWANPRGSDGYLVTALKDSVNVPEGGLIVHTVNCIRREDLEPVTSLEFRKGLWGSS